MKKEFLLADPYFTLLSPIERLKALYAVDPDYRKLPPADRWEIVRNVPSLPPVSANMNADDSLDPMAPMPPPEY